MFTFASTSNVAPSRALAAIALAGAAFGTTFGASFGAHASVTAPLSPVTIDGEFGRAAFGPSLGEIFQFSPYLFIDGLGNPALPTNVTVLNPFLSYSTPTWSGLGTSLATLEFSINNISPDFTFNDLRFVAFANPDGGADPYLDQVVAVNGAAAIGEPVRMEARAITAGQSIFDFLNNKFLASKNLTPGIDATCASVTGCDAEVALQWNASQLKPGESFVIKVGFSDNGQTLSNSYLQLLSRSDAATQLTLSGTGVVTSVPEPSTWLLLLAGLGVTVCTVRNRNKA
jgi:PEP-CTERM motif